MPKWHQPNSQSVHPKLSYTAKNCISTPSHTFGSTWLHGIQTMPQKALVVSYGIEWGFICNEWCLIYFEEYVALILPQAGSYCLTVYWEWRRQTLFYLCHNNWSIFLFAKHTLHLWMISIVNAIIHGQLGNSTDNVNFSIGHAGWVPTKSSTDRHHAQQTTIHFSLLYQSFNIFNKENDRISVNLFDPS